MHIACACVPGRTSADLAALQGRNWSTVTGVQSLNLGLDTFPFKVQTSKMARFYHATNFGE